MTTFAVLTRIDGCVFCCELGCQTTPTPTPAFDGLGRRVFETVSGQFMLVVEGVRGPSGMPPGNSLLPGFDGRPDLQIQNTRNLGNGSLAVCDTQPPNAGGVPGITPPNFALGNAFVTNVLNDFACRFEAFSRVNPCTRSDASGESRTMDPGADVQFCDIVARVAMFPPGESVLTARLRDQLGNLGPTAQIVVRVATPTPTP